MRRQQPMDEKPAKPRFSGFDRSVIHYGIGIMVAVAVYMLLFTQIQDQKREIGKLRAEMEGKDKLAEQSIVQLGQLSAQAQRAQISQSSLTELDKKALAVWLGRHLRLIDSYFVAKGAYHSFGSGSITGKDFDQAAQELAEKGHTPETVATGGKKISTNK